MKKNTPCPASLRVLLLAIAFGVGGCNKDSENNQSPQIADKNSVGCLATNDFYAVHFSVYLKPSGDLKNMDRAALLKPYCKELPVVGRAFFSADLIDEDIRGTPIGIRIVELADGTKKPEEFKEIRTLAEIPAKIYAKGVVEAQADIDKNGDYAMILIVGGENALSEDDKLKIPFHVGGNPYNPYGWPRETLIGIASGIGFVILGTIYLLYRLLKRRKLPAA
ncbi:conserved exported hypothetical protein [Crenothrix polyspora]|jgi:hypothetical protein|uniref:Lipoprotein n=1 Tax=Crenothrix polyspora TaxID=360316 RepID=A0A1R4HEC9_9GAMM|nr:hypothetical protein [Crenothrix polyspora]SJM94566.1 conserved exported hypothetical protein [Crenothrix polyspora]